MVILSKKQESVTNIHLNVKVINKGPSELFFSERRLSDLLVSIFTLSLVHVQVLMRLCASDNHSPPPPFPGSFLGPPCRVRLSRALKWH